MIKCLIFDCDGTLVDSEYICNLGLEIKLKEYGVESSAEMMMKKYRGGKLATILDDLEKEHCIKLNDDFEPSYRAIVDTLFEERLQPCEGVKEMLSSIDLPKCVASSGPLNKINKALSLTGLASYFNGNIYSSYEVGLWKPEPGLFIHAAEAMGFSPEQFAVVEDSPVGITAAQSASMLPVFYDPSEIYAHIKGVQKIGHMSELQNAIT